MDVFLELFGASGSVTMCRVPALRPFEFVFGPGTGLGGVRDHFRGPFDVVSVSLVCNVFILCC